MVTPWLHICRVLTTTLEAVAYRKEVIAIAASEDHLENAVSFFLHLRGRGYEHVVLITLSERGCLAWPQGMHQPPGCLWSSAPMPHSAHEQSHHKEKILFHLR